MPHHALADLSNLSGAWKAKSADYTAVANDKLLCDTTTAGFAVTLPASPAAGDEVWTADAKGQFSTHNLTIGRNGKTIKGAGSDLVLSTNYDLKRLVYTGTTWVY